VHKLFRSRWSVSFRHGGWDEAWYWFKTKRNALAWCVDFAKKTMKYFPVLLRDDETGSEWVVTKEMMEKALKHTASRRDGIG
jgi:hypothetical protein